MIPLAFAFVVFGVFWGGWAVAAIDVERFLHVSHAGFGLLLAGAIVGGAVTNTIGGSLAERRGTGPVLVRALLLWAALLAITGAVHARAAFAVMFVIAVAAGGLVDVVMNVSAAVAFGARPGRLMQFHGLFNAGTVVGALVTGLLLHAGLSWRVLWAINGGLAAATAWACARVALPTPPLEVRTRGEEGHRLFDGVRVMRDAHVVGLAFVFACGALLEGGIDTWGVLALRARLAISALGGAGAYVIGQSLATATRVGLGRSAGSFGAARGAALGALAASIGLTIEAIAHQPVVAGAGLALAAVGVSCCWPLLLAHAVSGRDRQGAIVGHVTAAGYLGFVGGPPVVGWIAGASGLASALFVLAAVGLVVATSPGHGARPVAAPTTIRT